MTTGSGIVSKKAQREAERKARCSGWRAQSYAVNGDPAKGEKHGDTEDTIDQIRIHNQTGVNKGCWKKAP